MDDSIQNGCLTSFVEFILKDELKKKETDSERRLWELWLHKVFDKTYNQFREAMKEQQNMSQKAKEMDDVDVEKAASVAMETLRLLSGGGGGHESV